VTAAPPEIAMRVPPQSPITPLTTLAAAEAAQSAARLAAAIAIEPGDSSERAAPRSDQAAERAAGAAAPRSVVLAAAPQFGLRAAAGATLEELSSVIATIAAAARGDFDGQGPQGGATGRTDRAPTAAEPGRAFAAPIPAPAQEEIRPRAIGRSAPRIRRGGAVAPGLATAGVGHALGRWGRLTLWLALALAVLALAGPASAQEITVDLGGGSLTARLAQLFVLITLLSLAPGLAIMVTCFPFMVTTLSILRQAIGVQQAPPNMMIVSLALFLTYFVIEPVFQQSWENGVRPLIDGEIAEDVGVERAFEPFRTFMEGRVDPDTLAVMIEASPSRDTIDPAGRPPVSVLIPSFLLSEVQRGFEVGFLIFLPFLIIDLVVASVLMSMGMMMVPPAVVALPFKLAFFVIADGWTLLAGALVRGYS
jgi:flagellar biosynthetic protein FliP